MTPLRFLLAFVFVTRIFFRRLREFVPSMAARLWKRLNKFYDERVLEIQHFGTDL